MLYPSLYVSTRQNKEGVLPYCVPIYKATTGTGTTKTVTYDFPNEEHDYLLAAAVAECQNSALASVPKNLVVYLSPNSSLSPLCVIMAKGENDVTGNHYIYTDLKSPIHIPAGWHIRLDGLFSVSHASNTVSLNLYGYQVPKVTSF